jgi:recombination protein RecR
MYLSKFIEDAVNELSKLPGVGKKTAFRYVLHLLDLPEQGITNLTNSIKSLKTNAKRCQTCNVINDMDTCSICQNPKRDIKKICIVENLKDLLAIEQTNQYFGLYHVLDGVISPLDGIGPSDLSIDLLEKRILDEAPMELIMALNPTIEGDTTIFYLTKKFSQPHIQISIISRGIAFGSELDYTDSLTLGRSIEARQPYQNMISN